MDNKERRQHERFRLDQCVSLSFGRETFLDAQGVNLSKGGLLFTSTNAVDIYEKFFVMIEVAQGVIKAEGLVIHSTPGDGHTVYGLKFTDIADEYRAILDSYCASIDG